jgi:chromosome segregation ATPase
MCHPRSRDLQKQNSILHQHLESVNSQASRIRQAAEQSSGEQGNAAHEDETSSDLRPVVAWLRSEKEIVDLQLELNKQENVRLKAQVDHLSRSLEETRATLSEVRGHIYVVVVTNASVTRNASTQQGPLHQPHNTLSYLNASISSTFSAKAMLPFDPSVMLIANNPRP